MSNSFVAPMQTITTKYHAATDKRGARYSATASAGAARITIKENPEWSREASRGHIEAVKALRLRIGNGWPTQPMLAGALNERGDLVWVFIAERSPRILAGPDRSRVVSAPVSAGAYPAGHKWGKSAAHYHAVDADENGYILSVWCSKVTVENILPDSSQFDLVAVSCKSCLAKLKRAGITLSLRKEGET